MRARNPGKGLRDHEYDYDDEFIDDSEMLAYLGGDRRRTKHSGFFINKVRVQWCVRRTCAERAAAWLRSVMWGCTYIDAAFAACWSGSLCLLRDWCQYENQNARGFHDAACAMITWTVWCAFSRFGWAMLCCQCSRWRQLQAA